MASNLELVRPHGSMRERLIVALDVDDLERVKGTVKLLASEVGMFKIGKQLFTHAGPQAVRLIQETGGEVFLDLKFHDIPTTVAKAAVEATRLGGKMFNVHASGSLEMMRATAKEARRVCHQQNLRKPIMLAVTVLTSLNQDDLKRVGVEDRKSTRLNSSHVKNLVCRLLLEKKKAARYNPNPPIDPPASRVRTPSCRANARASLHPSRARSNRCIPCRCPASSLSDVLWRAA